jgi:hypothetical protein
MEYLKPLIKGEAEITYKEGLPKIGSLKLLEVTKKLKRWI